MDSNTLDRLIAFRHRLHAAPELSGRESQTAGAVAAFLRACGADTILSDIGGHGVAAVFDGRSDGETLMLRAELDALPIREEIDLPYRSGNSGVSHKCGHDGHMAILAGIAAGLRDRRPRRGRIVLLFQPAEETGAGARRVVQDARFDAILPDRVFALHNMPGYPAGAVAVRDRHMASASTGIKVSLTGRTAHAMSPGDGVSPVEAVKSIHTRMGGFCNPDRDAEDFSLITTVGIRIGREDYGVAPGDGALMVTVRAYRNQVLAALEEKIRALSARVAAREGLAVRFSTADRFPATINDPACSRRVREAALANGIRLVEMRRGLATSEDFGVLAEASRRGGALFLLGAGRNRPGLHTPDFDFNDAIIADGVRMFHALCHAMLDF